MKDQPIPSVLTIAGSDSGGGAGIQGDLKTFQAHHVHGLSILTCITAQNTRTITGVYDLPPEFITKQFETVFEDFRISAVKVGMVSTSPIIQAVAEGISAFGMPNVILDPVMHAKSGDSLIAPQAHRALVQYLVPLAHLVTPNLPEAELLSHMSIQTLNEMKEAARIIVDAGAKAVLVKGGHLDPASPAVDILYDGRCYYEFATDRIQVPQGVHGTGCAYSSAIAAGLAQGLNLVDAISKAKSYITTAIKHCFPVGQGHPVLDHIWFKHHEV